MLKQRIITFLHNYEQSLEHSADRSIQQSAVTEAVKAKVLDYIAQFELAYPDKLNDTTKEQLAEQELKDKVTKAFTEFDQKIANSTNFD